MREQAEDVHPALGAGRDAGLLQQIVQRRAGQLAATLQLLRQHFGAARNDLVV